MPEAFASFRTVCNSDASSGHHLSVWSPHKLGNELHMENWETFGACILFITSSFRRYMASFLDHPHGAGWPMGVLLAYVQRRQGNYWKGFQAKGRRSAGECSERAADYLAAASGPCRRKCLISHRGLAKVGNFSLERGNLHGSLRVVRLDPLGDFPMAYWRHGPVRFGVVVND